MTNISLAKSYLEKAQKRLKILEVLFQEDAFSDVIREAQEAVELAQKAMLRWAGIDPPKWHDVGPILIEHEDKFPPNVKNELAGIAQISKRLRKERELSFYGDLDFIPTEEYSAEDARTAIDDANLVVETAGNLIDAQQ